MHNQTISKQNTSKTPSRHQTRLVAIQAVIEGLCTNFKHNIANYLTHCTINIDQTMCKKIYECVHENGKMLTDILQTHVMSKNFDLMDVTYKAILYCAVAEMIYLHTPIKVLISEYILLSKRLIQGSGYKLIHSVLDCLNKKEAKI